jgi:hypothetical protein
LPVDVTFELRLADFPPIIVKSLQGLDAAIRKVEQAERNSGTEQWVAALAAELNAPVAEVKTESNTARNRRKAAFSSSSMTRVAVFLAGRKRSAVREEWRSHLYGWNDRRLSQREQVHAARGFLWSAVRYRLDDAARLGWRPVDAVLGSRTLSNLTVWIPFLVAVLPVVHHDGMYGLIANAENLTALWGGLYAAIRVGRWYRRVKPERKPSRAG